MKSFIKNEFAKIIAKRSQWAVSLYQANKDNPFEPKKIDNIKYPLISAEDINDCNASFVADPFLVKSNNQFYLFFEIKNDDINRGVIGVASSQDGLNYNYEKIVLQESFHLSYPAVYNINNQWFMIPETGESNEVRIYTTNNFPYDWKLQKTLLKGRNFADATIIFHKNTWYLFVSDDTHTLLEIYYSDKFYGEYKPHSKNPIYQNKKIARPAGHLFKFNNKLYRFSQDCSRRYGEKVNMFEITKLTPFEYEEKFIKHIFEPIAGINWNAKKTHHICYLELEDKYLIATDGEGFKRK